MDLRICRVPPPTFNRSLDIALAHLFLLGASVRDDGLSLVEKVQQPVIHMLPPHPKFINTIPQKIRLRSPQFMTRLFKPADSVKEFVPWIIRNLVQPNENGRRPIKLRIKDNIDPGHNWPPTLFTIL
jgi:hypothetical protein